jgi:hypothetical protein
MLTKKEGSMKKNYLSILIAMLVLAGIPGMAQSALVTKTFIGTVINGPLSGDIGTGSFTYNDDLLIFGDEVIEAADGLKVTFSFGGQPFDQTNDIDFDEFPIVAFENFIPVELGYNLVDGVNGVDFNNPLIAELVIFELSTPGGNFDFKTDIFVAYVPIPGALWLLGSGIAGLAVIRRRRRNKL